MARLFGVCQSYHAERLMYIAEEWLFEVPLVAPTHKIPQTLIVFGIRQKVLAETPPPETLLTIIQLHTKCRGTAHVEEQQMRQRHLRAKHVLA